MKKIIYILLLLMPFLFINKVNAEEDNYLYNYKVTISVDKDKQELDVRHSFMTGELSLTSFSLINRENNKKDLKTNIKELDTNNSSIQFELEENDEYYIQYTIDCPNLECSYFLERFKANNELVKYDNLEILIKTSDGSDLPKYKIIENTGLEVGESTKEINAYNKYGPNASFRIDFEPVTNNIIKEAGTPYIILFSIISIYILITIIITIIYFIENKIINNGIKKIKYEEDKVKTLEKWMELKRINIGLHVALVYAILVIVLSFLPYFIILSEAAFRGYGSVTTSKSLLVLLYIGIYICFNIAPCVLIIKYRIAKMEEIVKKGTLYRYTSYKEYCQYIESEHLYVYKLEVVKNIDGKDIIFSSGKRKTNEYLKNSEVFLLYLDNNNYYVDYLIPNI